MSKLLEHLKPYLQQPGVEAFVLDHIPDQEENNYEDENYVAYHYQTNRYNLLKPGDVFIYRTPAKYTSDHQFYFYGGGVIDRIEPVPGKSHEVKAIIKEPFKLEPNIMQKDVLDFDWPHKPRSSQSYLRFWNQYGMNRIGLESFRKLLQEENWHSAIELDSSSLSRLEWEEDKTLMDLSEEAAFTQLPDDLSAASEESEYLGRYLLTSSNEKMSVAELGAQLVFQILQNDSSVEWIERGFSADRYGYRIAKEGGIFFISTKSTQASRKDGFYLSDREALFAKAKGNAYQIYRIYALDPAQRTFKLSIFDNPFSHDHLRTQPVVYKVIYK